MILNNANDLFIGSVPVERAYCNRSLIWSRDHLWIYNIEDDGCVRVTGYNGVPNGSNTSQYGTYYLKIPKYIEGLPVKYLGSTLGYTDSFNKSYYAETLIIPDSVEIVESYAFYNSVNLKNLTIGDGVRIIKDNAFCYCQKLYGITFGKGLNEIGASAFSQFASISNTPEDVRLVFNEGLEIIGDNAFESAYIGAITLPISLKKLGNYAFRNNRYLTEVFIPPNTESVGSYCFYGCTQLSSVIMPKSTQYASNSFPRSDIITFY